MEESSLATGTLSLVEPLTTPYDRERLEDVGFMTCMTLVLLGNYAQTGHFGGPLAYTPYNVATHLAGHVVRRRVDQFEPQPLVDPERRHRKAGGRYKGRRRR